MSRSKKWRLEWSFFLGENSRRQYNKVCLGCAHGCKQSFRAVLIACPRNLSKRSKKCRDKGEKRQNNLLYMLFSGSLYDFPCGYALADMKRKRFGFSHFS